MTWPVWTIGLACLGWLPGGLVFPAGIDLLAGPIEPIVYARFLVSFWLSGLVALTYSYFGVQYMTLRVFYPDLWIDGEDVRFGDGLDTQVRDGGEVQILPAVAIPDASLIESRQGADAVASAH